MWATLPDVEVAALKIAPPSGAYTVDSSPTKGGSGTTEGGRNLVIGSTIALDSPELALCLCLIGSVSSGPSISGAGTVEVSECSISLFSRRPPSSISIFSGVGDILEGSSVSVPLPSPCGVLGRVSNDLSEAALSCELWPIAGPTGCTR